MLFYSEVFIWHSVTACEVCPAFSVVHNLWRTVPHRLKECVQMWYVHCTDNVNHWVESFNSRQPPSNKHTHTHTLKYTFRNIHRERWDQWCVVVVCPFITQHKAPTIIHSLLCQTVEDLTFFTVIFMWTCLDKDIKLFYLNETKRIAYTQKSTANITHKNKAVSTNNSKLSKK